MGSSFILPTMPKEIAALRKWHLGVFAIYAGKKPEGLALLQEAAQLKPIYKSELPELLDKAARHAGRAARFRRVVAENSGCTYGKVIDTVANTLLVCAPFSTGNPNVMTKTFSAKANEVARQWWVIDAADQVLGRVAAKAANLLRGTKKSPSSPRTVDTGDFVIVINAEKVRVTGKKEEQKSYMSFSGYVGGHKSESVKSRRARHPELLVERAVKGMIPHNKLGRAVYTKLKVYSGSDHPHAAQQPVPVTEIV